MGTRRRRLTFGALVLVLGGASVGVAAAGISGGGYSPERQHCTGDADDADQPQHAEPGCRSAGISVADGHGTEGIGIGTQQTADGQTVSELTPLVASTDTMALTSGVSVVAAADDNLDNGEHDSSSVIHDGPSDGGAIVFGVDPATLGPWFMAIIAGDLQHLVTHPIPLLRLGAGSCADGICESVQTQQVVAFQGGDRSRSRDVADYEGQAWDPESCAGPSDTVADCGHDGIGYWHQRGPTTYLEPGVQVFEDPDPQGSPIGPYPLPAVAVTTCGLYLGGGPVQVPASPLTNDAGQLAVTTGC